MFTRKEPERSIRLKSPIVPILAVVLFVVQLLFPFKGWAILLSGFGGMWLVSYIWARSLKRGLRINRDMSFGWKQVGDRLRERVLLENNSWVPGLWVHVDDHSDMRDYEITTVTDVRGWRYRNWHTQGYCSHRGLFTLGPVTLIAEDPFGIYEVRVDYKESVNMMVVPPVVTLPEIEIASGGRVGEGRSSNKGLKQTVSAVGLREYVPGDSLRWLHWPTIARKGELYVHLFENEPTSDWWVLVDMDEAVQVGAGQQSTEEHAIMLAASLVNRGIQLGKYVGLIAQGKELVWHTPDIGDAHLWSILRSLATVRPGERSLDRILTKIKTDLGRNSSLIVITPNLSLDWIRALELLRRMGVIPTVLLLDPVSFGGEGSLDGVRNLLRKSEITHHIITSDLLDRPQKRARKKWDWLTSTHPAGEILDEWDVRWRKLRRFLRTWGLLGIFSYFFASILDGAVRGLEIDLIRYVILWGFVIGGLLAYSKWKGWLAGLTGVVVGLVLSILRIASLGDRVVDLFVRLYQLLLEVSSWIFQSAGPPDYQPLLLRMEDIWSRGTALALRLWAWARAILAGQSIYDPVVITFLWSLTVWVVVVWSIWAIIRKHDPLTGLVPALSLVGISVAVVGKTAYDLVFMMGAMILLVTLVYHDVREHTWQAKQLGIAAGIRRNVLIASFILAVCLMVFSLVTPSISIDRIADYFREMAAESTDKSPGIARSLGLEKQSEEVALDVLEIAMMGGLPNEHLIGSGSELSDQVVMEVSFESPPGIELEAPIYFQSLVYDVYTGRGWESRGAEIETYAPGDTLATTQPEHAFPVRQQVQFLDDLNGFMFTAGLPMSADQTFKVAWRVKDHQNGIYDILGATVESDSYRADSYVPVYSVEELQSAGQDYPGWILDRYLSLPASIPERLLALAVELTATGATPYDRAVAIEQYLRKIPYSLSVSTGPAGTDIVEYFLFRLERGYCDYYATAMVVLARAAGIPARYVAGYIGENYDEREDVYIITADQAHAWAEVFFPGYGWVPFEPTGSRPPMDRPPEPFPELPSDFSRELSPLVPAGKFPFIKTFTGILISLMVVIILGMFGWWLSDRWLQRYPLDTLIPRLYKRIYLYARWAGLSVHPGDTAYTFAEALCTYLSQLSRNSYWMGWMTVGVPLINRITQVFVQTLFDPQKIVVDKEEILRDFMDLRSRLWVLWLFSKAYHYRIFRPFVWENVPVIISMTTEES